MSFDLAGPRASFPAQLTQLPILPLGTLSRGRDPGAAQGRRACRCPRRAPFYVVQLDLDRGHAVPQPPRRRPAPAQPGGDRPLRQLRRRRRRVPRGDGRRACSPPTPCSAPSWSPPAAAVHDIATFRFVDLLFNERGLLADPAVRQAIATAIDRTALVAGPLRGMAVAGAAAIPHGHRLGGAAAAAARRQPGGRRRARSTPPAGPPAATVSASTAATRLQLRLAVADIIPLPDLAAGISAQLARRGHRRRGDHACRPARCASCSSRGGGLRHGGRRLGQRPRPRRQLVLAVHGGAAGRVQRLRRGRSTRSSTRRSTAWPRCRTPRPGSPPRRRCRRSSPTTCPRVFLETPGALAGGARRHHA